MSADIRISLNLIIFSLLERPRIAAAAQFERAIKRDALQFFLGRFQGGLGYDFHVPGIRCSPNTSKAPATTCGQFY